MVWTYLSDADCAAIREAATQCKGGRLQKLADRLDQQRAADDALKLRMGEPQLEEALAEKAKEAEEWRHMYFNKAEKGRFSRSAPRSHQDGFRGCVTACRCGSFGRRAGNTATISNVRGFMKTISSPTKMNS